MKGPTSWSQILAIFAMIQGYSSAESLVEGVFSAVESAGAAVVDDAADVKAIVLGEVVQIASSQCSPVKTLLGVDYQELDHEDKAYLNQLKMNFYSPEMNMTFNLSSVDSELPATKGYNPEYELALLVHGFTDSSEGTNIAMINEAFQSIGQTNVLALDASSLIKYLYLRSTTYVQFIGEILGKTLAALVNTAGVARRLIHLIGHSLGAHIVGFAGKTFTNLTDSNVGRITGLDPAGPCFTNVDDDMKLKKTDADFVVVIHTDAGVYGIEEPLGDIDYFPNSGSQQPGCVLETCNHGRVVELFTESITNRYAFPSIRCESWNAFKKGSCYEDRSFMGLNSTSSDVYGQYYLQTNSTKPYGLGEEGLTYNADGIL